MMVLLSLCAKLCVDSWFATIPAGTDIIIANEKLKATITSNALIFLLEMFLTALVNAPKRFTLIKVQCLIQERPTGKQSTHILPFDRNQVFLSSLLPPLCFVQVSSREESLIKPFFRIIPNSIPNPIAELVVAAVNMRAGRPLRVHNLCAVLCQSSI
jgi:hypothetical protein